jgi:hypothetical protein
VGLHVLHPPLHTLQLEYSMFFMCLVVAYFVRHGFTVDDLGFLLIMVAVIILFMLVAIIRAAVGSFTQGLPVL